MIKIMFVCHGNICRSPMAEFIMKDIARKNNDTSIIISSSATSTEEIGNDMYYESKKILDKYHIKYQPRQARRFTIDDYNDFNYIIIMDSYNYYNILKIIKEDSEHKIYKLLAFTGTDDDISDPWYNRNFDKCYHEITSGCLKLYEYVKKSE